MTDETRSTPPTAGDLPTTNPPAGTHPSEEQSAVDALSVAPAPRRASVVTAPLSQSAQLPDGVDLEPTKLLHDPHEYIIDRAAMALDAEHAQEDDQGFAVTAVHETSDAEADGSAIPAPEPAVQSAAQEEAPIPIRVTNKLEEPDAEDQMTGARLADQEATTKLVRPSELEETTRLTHPAIPAQQEETMRLDRQSNSAQEEETTRLDRSRTSGPVPAANASPTPQAVERDPARDAEFARYYAVRNHFGPIAFSPDLTQIAYITNTSGQFNIWRQNINGGWPSQVTTFEEETVRSLIWTPSGDIIGAADRSGGEQYDLFTIPALGGAVRYLTNQPDAQFEMSEEGLSPDGRYLVFSGNDRTPTDGDVLIRDLQTGETRRALANGHFNVALNWSPDGRFVTVVDIRSNTDMRLWLVEAATGEARELLPHDDEFYLAPGPWLPDSSGLYLITDRGSQFKGIARYLLSTDDMEWVVKPEWDVEQLSLSADGRRLLWTLNESGRSQLHVRDNNQASLRVSGLPVGVIEYMRLSPDGQSLALRINSATAPAEVYALSLGSIGSVSTPHLRRLTYGMLGGLAPSELIAPELVRYPTFDGREIPAWLYRPRGVSESHPAPLVISIHGGPEAQERVEYRALYQFLLSRGIGILAPNVRGSTGYGKAYQKLIHRDWGGGELRDIQATADYARTLSWVNERKLGIYGGSFGGFATLSAVTRLPDYWAAAVDVVGPSNLLTFVRSVPPTWRRMMAAWVGDPDEDADLLRQRSPITYVEQARAPLLVLQGANDPRVVKAESDQMVETLRKHGRDVEYVVFPDEGHGFTRRVNLLRGYSLTADFFERHLK